MTDAVGGEYTWPDSAMKLTTEGGWARWFLLGLWALVLLTAYAKWNGTLLTFRNEGLGEVVRAAIAWIGLGVFAFWLLHMFPRIQTFVRALRTSNDGLHVSILTHDIYLNSKRRKDRFYPWSDVQGVALQGLDTIEGCDLGMYSVDIRLDKATDIGGVLVIRYTRAHTDDAKSRAEKCFEEIYRRWPSASAGA